MSLSSTIVPFVQPINDCCCTQGQYIVTSNRPGIEITNMTATFYISLLVPLNNQKEIFGSMRLETKKNYIHQSDKEAVTVDVELHPSDN